MINRSEQPTGPIMVVISALIFGFFGFFPSWNIHGAQGQVLMFMVIFVWTLRISAGLFVLSALITMARPVMGNLLYALVGVVGAGSFFVVAVMDIADTDHTVMPYAPIILLIFAAWNGFGSWMALRSVLARRQSTAVAVGGSQTD